jgi:hypothetical protein
MCTAVCYARRCTDCCATASIAAIGAMRDTGQEPESPDLTHVIVVFPTPVTAASFGAWTPNWELHESLQCNVDHSRAHFSSRERTGVAAARGDTSHHVSRFQGVATRVVTGPSSQLVACHGPRASRASPQAHQHLRSSSEVGDVACFSDARSGVFGKRHLAGKLREPRCQSRRESVPRAGHWAVLSPAELLPTNSEHIYHGVRQGLRHYLCAVPEQDGS